MLSRIAESLFWIGRYVERADNTARILDIHLQLVVEDAEVRKGVTMPAEWADAVAQSAKVSQIALPVVIPVTEFRDIYGVALTNLLGGADPAAELKAATEQFKPILERSEA